MDVLENMRASARADPRPTRELFEEAGRLYPNRDEHAIGRYWAIVSLLYCRADEAVLQRAQEFSVSKNPIERSIAANVLAQIHVVNPALKPEAAKTLLAMTNETDDEVLGSIGYAFGHLSLPEGIPFLERIAESANADLRFAAATSLPGVGHLEPERVFNTLVKLSNDTDSDVRDWATFGLGAQLDLDTPALREALVRRLKDSDEDARKEAISGLAQRGDVRVLGPFLSELHSGGETVSQHSRLAESAEEILKFADSNLSEPWTSAAAAIRNSGKFSKS